MPNLHPSIDPNVPHDARASAASLASRRDGAVIAEVKAERLPPITNLDKHIDTPLGPFVVPAAKLVDRDTQIRYCYTELGLRYDRHLTGDVTVRVSLSSAGLADTVEVTKRTWDGVPAAEVESCMRALIEDWSFDDRQPPDARTVELHFTLTPAMRTAPNRRRSRADRYGLGVATGGAPLDLHTLLARLSSTIRWSGSISILLTVFPTKSYRLT
jgi:hypothetical protein